MITPEQIQTILKRVSAAPTTVGESYVERPSIDALIQLGQQLTAGRVLKFYTADEAAIADRAVAKAARK